MRRQNGALNRNQVVIRLQPTYQINLLQCQDNENEIPKSCIWKEVENV
jgi:hypothetical protein